MITDSILLKIFYKNFIKTCNNLECFYRWWYTSDTLVHEVSLQEVLRCTAYMLFYERQNQPASHVSNYY